MELVKAYVQVLCWLAGVCTHMFEGDREIYQPGLSIRLLLIKIDLECFCGLETKLYVLIKL
jgi:hypothetical protein